MRRLGGYILLGLGVFLLVLAPVVKFVVGPASVKAPLTVPAKYSTLIAVAANGGKFTFLDPTQQKETQVDIRITRTIQGDVLSGDGTNAVYNESLCLTVDDGTHPGCVAGGDPRLITNSTDRVAFNRKSGLAVDNPKYFANVNGDTSIKHSGLAYKFPIDTKKKTYSYFDTVADNPFPAVFQGTEKIDGLSTYKFVQTITDQPVLTNFLLPSLYSDTRTMWVEPTTGVIVKGSEVVDQRLTGRASLDPNSALVSPALTGATALKGTLVFDDATVKLQAQLAKDNLSKIHLVRIWIPLIGLIVGLIALLAGLALLLSGRASGEHSAEDRSPREVLTPQG